MRRLIPAAISLLMVATAPVAAPARAVAGPAPDPAAPAVTTHGERVLAATADRLDRAARQAPAGVTSWYADPAADRVVVTALPGADAAARAFAAAAGAPAGTIQVLTEAERPRQLADVRGGDPFYSSLGLRCSVAFTVVGGFLTNGHCGRPGLPVYAANGQRMGVFTTVSPSTADWAHVRLDPGWRPLGQVRGPAGTYVPVAGSISAPVGGSVCRYGNTTGWHCGTILAKNVTVNYPGGTVHGLTRTNVCAEPGDSGGPFISGHQAQGMTSGGSGNCAVGGITYFQPVNPPLAALGLTLVTSLVVPRPRA